MEKVRMQQDFDIHKSELNNQLKIAKIDNSANVLTKYRMNWLSNLKNKTSLFEELFLKIIHTDSHSYRENKKQLEEAQVALTNFTSSLKSDLNLTKEIDLEIIKGFISLNEIISKINILKNKTHQSYLNKCIQANNLGLLEKEKLEEVKKYESELSKFSIPEEEKHFYHKDHLEYVQQQYYSVVQNYEFSIPNVIEIENSIFSYYHKKITSNFNKYSIMLRTYFKTEWERIKIEIANDDEKIKRFDFEETFSRFLSDNLLYDNND